MEIQAAIAYLTKDPRYAWIALIVALVPVIKFLIREVPAIIKSISPIRSSIEEMAASERQASDAMNQIAEDFGVDRAGLALFHNGTKSMANIHMLKVSVIAEGLSGRVGSIMNDAQSRTIGEYGRILYDLINSQNPIKIKSVTSIKDTEKGAHAILHNHLVKSAYVMPIFANKKSIDGCVFVEYCVDEVELDDAMLAQIQARAQAVYNELYLVNNGK